MEQSYADAAHLFRRAGFGALHEEVEAYKNWAWEDLVDLVLDVGRAPTPPALPNLADSRAWYDKYVDMAHYWLDLARRPVDQAPVVEKVVLFMSGLLTSSLDKTQDFRGLMEQNDAFRRRGMGDYRTLLQEISINSAMIRYLDNADNVVGHPNENFSRELMELFTLGVGNYTQQDVTEAGRAWTGHGLDHFESKRYQFRPEKHDGGSKTFLGATGNWDGPDIINLILDRRRNAHSRFMCQKLWSFFAYPVGLNDQVVTDIMGTYSVGLNIRDTLRAIFLHPKFRSDQARWALVRSPVEYLVAVMRHTNTDCSILHPEWSVSAMGQVPFNPPNVSGWRQNGYWLSSTAAWSKFQVANHIRWHCHARGDISDASEITWAPTKKYTYTPTQSVDKALWNFKVGPIEAAGKNNLIEFVHQVRASDHYWSERAGMFYLILLLPELQVA